MHLFKTVIHHSSSLFITSECKRTSNYRDRLPRKKTNKQTNNKQKTNVTSAVPNSSKFSLHSGLVLRSPVCTDIEEQGCGSTMRQPHLSSILCVHAHTVQIRDSLERAKCVSLLVYRPRNKQPLSHGQIFHNLDKLKIKLPISPSHNILTLGQSVPALTPCRQAFQ